jgi:cytochrome c oxidase subunit III
MSEATNTARPPSAPLDVDASLLPSYAFSHRSLMWWGTLGLIAIEGTAFGLAIVAYFYLWTLSSAWPPDVAPPELRWGTLNLAIMLASLIPNEYTKRAAERHDLPGVRIGIVVCLVFALAFLGVRVLEYGALNCHWDTNAYASAVWVLLSLHTVHLVTDAYDSGVLAVLMFTGPMEDRRFADVSENAVYWYFVVASWVAIYGVIYLFARLV